MDGDERLDIVMSGSPSGVTGVYWHRNLGMRTWGNLQPIATQLPGTRFATANLDGDLMADFFVAVDASAGAALRVLSTAAR